MQSAEEKDCDFPGLKVADPVLLNPVNVLSRPVAQIPTLVSVGWMTRAWFDERSSLNLLPVREQVFVRNVLWRHKFVVFL